MCPLIFRCPPWLVGLLIAGAIAPLGILAVIPTEGWPPAAARILVGVSLFMVVYALTLLPSRLVVSDEGVSQKLLFSEWRLRWEDMVEWRHCAGGAAWEEGEMSARTKGRWHSTEFWVKDRRGQKHHLKSWLVFGRRSRQVAEAMRARGIDGG